MNVLRIDNVSKAFDGRRIIDHLSFSVDAGEAVALAGGNGSGKTTLMRMAAGLLAPDEGSVLIEGRPVGEQSLQTIGYLPEERGLYRHERAGAQTIYVARLNGLDRSTALREAHGWFKRFALDAWWDTEAAHLSKGMQQRLQIIMAVVHKPRLLLLDEPFSGFDADNSALLTRELLRLKDEGCAILLSTHNADAMREICNKKITL